MANLKLPYVEAVFSKGKSYFYFRRHGKRIPLPADPASIEFMAEYNRIRDSFEDADNAAILHAGSIAALVADYRGSTDYLQLSARSRRDYGIYLDEISSKFGKFMARDMTRKVALAWRDSMAAKPAKANYAMAVLRKVLSFACDRGYVQANVALRPRRLKTGAHAPWKDEQIEKFLASAAPQMRLALLLALYTGQRQGDVLAMRWNQITDGGIEVVQQKTGEKVWIPMHPVLRAAIASVKNMKAAVDKDRRENGKPPLPDSVTILSNSSGKPWTSDYFKHVWHEACKAVAIEGVVFHGLRKTAAVRMAEAGCTMEQIKAITGHRTNEMAAHYTRQANQKVLAKAAVRKLERRK